MKLTPGEAADARRDAAALLCARNDDDYDAIDAILEAAGDRGRTAVILALLNSHQDMNLRVAAMIRASGQDPDELAADTGLRELLRAQLSAVRDEIVADEG